MSAQAVNYAESMRITTTSKESYKNDTVTNTELIRPAGKSMQLHGPKTNDNGEHLNQAIYVLTPARIVCAFP